MLRHVVLNVLRLDKSVFGGISVKRKELTRDDDNLPGLMLAAWKDEETDRRPTRTRAGSGLEAELLAAGYWNTSNASKNRSIPRQRGEGFFDALAVRFGHRGLRRGGGMWYNLRQRQ